LHFSQLFIYLFKKNESIQDSQLAPFLGNMHLQVGKILKSIGQYLQLFGKSSHPRHVSKQARNKKK
jgi:hypothetical protein